MRKINTSITLTFLPSGPYSKKDPQFWRANLEIRWKKSEAGERARGGAIAAGIWMPRMRFLDLLRRGLNPETRDREEMPEPSEKKARKMGRQMRRILPVLKKFYPPHGKAPDDVSTEAVRVRVNNELAPDSKNQGLADASWDSVNRALGRAK